MNHNPDAANNYMQRLRMLRQGGGGGNDNQGMGNSMPDPSMSSSSGFNNNGYSGNGSNMGNNNGMMNNMMGNMQQQMQQQMQQGQGSNNNKGRGQEDFTIEEYQASLQQFLSHNDDFGGGGDNRPDFMMSRDMSERTQHHSNVYHNNNNNGQMSGGNIACIQVPTNLGDGSNNNNKRNRRGSLRSVDDMDIPIGRNTFKSVDSNDRPSFQFMDDMDIRGTFRSVDTMDMMSIGNSINEIMEDDIKHNPEAVKKYNGRRMSQNSRYSKGGGTLSDLAHLPGQTLEVKTMDHGKGKGGPKKIKNKGEGGGGMIDPRLALQNHNNAGTRHSVQTKDCDGPSGGGTNRGSMFSMNLNLDGVDDTSRMSFGNMSIMSELTDFQDIIAKGNMDSFNQL